MKKKVKENVKVKVKKKVKDQVLNTSSRKDTEVKQVRPRLELGWVTIHGLDVNAVRVG